jgi:phosphoglycolate phosphatase-like HAD superfamily hydrolase
MKPILNAKRSRIARIVFDFDNTLFDSEAKKQGLYRIAEVHGYSLAEAMEFYDKARVRQEKIMMSLSSYVDVLREALQRDGKLFLAGDVSDIISHMRRGDGLLPGATELLKTVQKKMIPLYLLTLGVREWQEEKVEQSGIVKYFSKDNIIYTELLNEGKKQSLKELFGSDFTGQDTLLVNDKASETMELLAAFPDLVALVRVELRDPRNSAAEYEQLASEYAGRVAMDESLLVLTDMFETLYE